MQQILSRANILISQRYALESIALGGSIGQVVRSAVTERLGMPSQPPASIMVAWASSYAIIKVPADWAAHPVPMEQSTPRGRNLHLLQFGLPPALHTLMDEAVAAQGQSRSAWVRDTLSWRLAGGDYPESTIEYLDSSSPERELVVARLIDEDNAEWQHNASRYFALELPPYPTPPHIRLREGWRAVL